MAAPNTGNFYGLFPGIRERNMVLPPSDKEMKIAGDLDRILESCDFDTEALNTAVDNWASLLQKQRVSTNNAGWQKETQ